MEEIKCSKPVEDLSFEKDLQKHETNGKLNLDLDLIYDYDLESKAIEKNSEYIHEDFDKKDIKDLLSIINEDKKISEKEIGNDIINLNFDYIDSNKQKNEYFHENENGNNYNNTNDHYNACKEILSILKKPLSNKNIRNRKYNIFKPLKKPRKISLVGRVLSDFSNEENNNSNENIINEDKKNNDIVDYNSVTRGSTQNIGENTGISIGSELYEKK